MSKPHSLSIQQKKFCDFYLEGMPAVTAFVKAGYSAKHANSSASRMLRVPHVAAYIEAEREAMSERTRIKKWEVLDFLSDTIKTPVGEIDETSPLAQEVTRDEIGEEVVRSKIKMVGKIDAVDRLAKLLGWYAPEKHEVQFEVTIGGDSNP